MTVLRAEHVTIKRGTRTVISELDLDANAGEIVGVVGTNGTGKSTLLMAIAGVLEPSDGRITIDGASVWGSSPQRQRARSHLGYVPENADPPGFLRASELWALCATTRSASPPSPELTAALGLDELADLAIERMSLGQRRRACLAAALLGPPSLLVLDEPDNGLDTRRTEALVTLVRAHASAGGAAVISTHDRGLLDAIGARLHTLGQSADHALFTRRVWGLHALRPHLEGVNHLLAIIVGALLALWAVVLATPRRIR